MASTSAANSRTRVVDAVSVLALFELIVHCADIVPNPPALIKHPLLPVFVVKLLNEVTTEETGGVPVLLGQAAEYRTKELDVALVEVIPLTIPLSTPVTPEIEKQ